MNSQTYMNKYIIIGILIVAIFGGGFIYKAYFSSDQNRAMSTGAVKEFTVVSKKLQWTFEPESISVEQGDTVKLHVINEDDFDHGVAIDAFGISQRLPALGTIDIEFVATKSGEFPFYCSVSCSDSGNSSFNLQEGLVQDGIHKGVARGHFDHIGKFIVNMFNAVTGQ